MRFWLKPDERRPSPAPVVTDDRRAFLTGLVLWLIALAFTVILGAQLPSSWLWCAVAGVALGALGLAWTQFRRRRP